MPRFFTQTISPQAGSITGPDARHISRVLRMKPGDPLTVCDGQGVDYQCTILTLGEELVELSVHSAAPSGGEPSIAVHLFQAMPKGDKLELIIQKAVELGAASVTPVQTLRCVSRPDPKAMSKKLERYNRIAYEAAKQCGRGRIPQVFPLLDYSQALEQLRQSSCSMLFFENSTASFRQALEPLGQAPSGCSVSLLVGAEGGFSEEEIQAARRLGIPILSLGSRILRCETAPLAALSVLMFQTGNLG